VRRFSHSIAEQEQAVFGSFVDDIIAGSFVIRQSKTIRDFHREGGTRVASLIVNANHGINVVGCRPSIFANLEASAAPEKSRPQKVRE
jgi:hypothetical protein